VQKLNTLTEDTGYDIVLSSDRRRGVGIEKINERFKARGVEKPIIAHVPDYNEGIDAVWLNRRQEIEMFLVEFKPDNYLILDDDKSLSGASEEIKSNWTQTYMSIGLKVKQKLIKWNQTQKGIMINRKNIGILLLWVGTFLNPFGFAELTSLVMKMTGWEYWTTMHLFYVLAALSYLGFFFLLKINPIKIIKEKLKKS